MERYRLKGKVTRIWEAEHQRHVGGFKEETIFETEKQGWYVEISRLQSFFVGYDKPALKEGQLISIIIEPEPELPVAAIQPIHPIQAAGERAYEK